MLNVIYKPLKVVWCLWSMMFREPFIFCYEEVERFICVFFFFSKILFKISNAMMMEHLATKSIYLYRVALLAQWQSTGLVNQGSGVRSSYRAAFILEFFWFSYLIFKTIFCPIFCPLLKKTISIFYMAMKNVFIEQKVEIIYS